jgi:hypothetical protein
MQVPKKRFVVRYAKGWKHTAEEATENTPEFFVKIAKRK